MASAPGHVSCDSIDRTAAIVTAIVIASLAAACGISARSSLPGAKSTRSSDPPGLPRRAIAGPTTSTAPPTPPSEVRPPLTGITVGVDPGHNGLNYTQPEYLAHQVFNGRTPEDCDTTGTETADGYTEALFNFNVAQYLTTDLEAEGASVVATRTTNSGIGPCVDQRAQILNAAHPAVAIDIHADGGPPDGRGFAVLEPVADGFNDAVISSSATFGSDVRSAFLGATEMPVSTYDGTDGIVNRSDLAGLNLTTVPKVLIECGNMRNPTDAALLESASFQQMAAQALTQAITQFVRSP